METSGRLAEALIKWDAQYNLGLPEIDEQHQSLANLINGIWQAIVGRADTKTVFSLIAELETYTLAHFTAEETFMRVTAYPKFDEHKQEHQEFAAKVAKEKENALAMGTLSLDLMYFLRDWLVNHILKSDRDYADFTRQSKQSGGSFLSRLFRRFS